VVRIAQGAHFRVMANEFREGFLVEICGFKGEVQDQQDSTSDAKFNPNGLHAQLVEYKKEDNTWNAMTFDGRFINVGTDSMRLLDVSVIPDIDLVIGPGSDDAIVTQELVSSIVNKGYVVCHYITSAPAVKQMQEVASDMKYTRIPAEFEPYYLGTQSKEKTALIDFESEDTPRAVANSPFANQDESMGTMCGALTPYLEDILGIRVTSRTNLLVRQTFANDDDESDYPPPGEPTNSERETFLSLIKRRRVSMMHFLGPLTGALTLSGKGNDAGTVVEVTTRPCTMVVFLTERFTCSHFCEGATLTLHTWFLGARPEFQMQDIGGDMNVLGTVSKGSEPPPGQTVAVNGISCMIGGDSKDPGCYWCMFNKAGGDTFREIPISRWDINVYCFHEDLQTAQMRSQSYTKHQGLVDGIEYFDSHFFGISNAEAGGMDPNQRKTLEVVYSALNVGGYEIKKLARDPAHIGCFVGISGSEWGSIPHQSDAAGCGQAEAIISNRVNFNLNLKGASQTINTACSAGLVAMHTAKLHLLYKDFDPLEAVVASGINLAYSPFPFIGCCGGNMLSYKGRSFTFDVGADGYGRGEGTSCVFMNIEEYKETVYALVAGSQANQDGRSASITAPNGPSQEKCIKAAFREASLKPPEVDCFECHGTGTALGDPIEVGAFKRIYNSSKREHTLMVTTSKTNLGHLEGGAGMAGFVKCCLQVMRCEGSPNLHLREKNPHLDVDGFPALLMTEGLTCQYGSAYSGVSSFGFGGTNAHAMAYGKNRVTSRGTGQRDWRMAMQNKILEAPPPEISMYADDPDQWESNGMPLEEENIGKQFQVEVSESGKAIWREVVEPDAPTHPDRFYFSSSTNDWGMEQMKPDTEIPDLFAFEVDIGPTGQELFVIVGDEDPQQTYFPDAVHCTKKTTPIMGPGMPPGERDEYTWCITGEYGSKFRVEWFCTDETVSVVWMPTPPSLEAGM